MQLKSINSLDLCPLCLRSFKCQFSLLQIFHFSQTHSHENSNNTAVIWYHPHKKSTEQLITDSFSIQCTHLLPNRSRRESIKSIKKARKRNKSRAIMSCIVIYHWGNRKKKQGRKKLWRGRKKIILAREGLLCCEYSNKYCLYILNVLYSLTTFIYSLSRNVIYAFFLLSNYLISSRVTCREYSLKHLKLSSLLCNSRCNMKQSILSCIYIITSKWYVWLLSR
jgi:hypothetical protein